MIDKKLNYRNMLKLTNEQVYALLCKLYPNHQLYNISTGWRGNKSFILKSKGVAGDVIIGWR